MVWHKGMASQDLTREVQIWYPFDHGRTARALCLFDDKGRIISCLCFFYQIELPHGAVANLEGDVHVAALAFDVVGIEGLGIAPLEDAALATRLTIVQASPSVDDIGLALFAGGIVYTGYLHWTSD